MFESRLERTWVLLTDGPLSMEDGVRFVRDDSAGAIDVFVGTTREWTGDRQTERLSYEAYAPMAVAEMVRLCDEALDRHDLVRACIHHRTGEVAVGEASVVIAVSSAHRADAFAGARELIDRLKEHVPIWKRERYRDGTEEWVQPGGG